MGQLIYGANGSSIEFEDRLLAHLQLVITTKLRRGERFALTFPGVCGEGWSTIWVSEAIPLQFNFYVSEMPRIDHDWLEELALSACSSHGLRVTAAPALMGAGV